jgi:nitrate/nitrite-specific signal transduction histidine kinase
LEVRDDGRGINSSLLQSRKTGHFGMIGMRERALSLGGTLTVTSETDRGTTVSLSVPGRAVYLRGPWRLQVWIRDAVRRFRRYFSSPD